MYQHSQLVPAVGGVYHEAVLTTNPREDETITNHLTKVGFVEVNPLTKELSPALATSWEVLDGGKLLRLKLSQKLSANQALAILEKTDGPWKDTQVASPDDQTLEIRLSRPSTNFIYHLAEPIFPFGPYVKMDAKTTDTDKLIFTRNSGALKPGFIRQIDVTLFTDSAHLDRAIRKGEFEGVYFGESSQAPKLPSEWDQFERPIDREQVVFLNTRRGQLEDKTFRQKLIGTDRFVEPISLRLAVADNTSLKTLAEELRAQWSERNIDLIIETYPILTLSKTVIPEREYDLLLLGVDYGGDGDLFPYWHSSQIAAPGLNLAGFRDKQVDQLLDHARQEIDPVKRQEDYGKARAILSTEAAFLSLGKPKVYYHRSPEVTGEVPELLAMPIDRWHDIGSWHFYQKRTSGTPDQNYE